MMRRLFSALAAFAAAVLLGLPSARVLGAPPNIEVRGAFTDELTRERWQPLLVTVTNPEDGDAIRGEVQVALEDPRMGGARLVTYARAVSLPRGPGRAQVLVYVHIPDDVIPDVAVHVLSDGQVVRRKKITRLIVLPEQLMVLAVSEAPDALQYLRGQALDVVRNDGALRPAGEMPVRGGFVPPPGAAGQNNAFPAGAANGPGAAVAGVSPSVLPDKPLGYDAVSIVYLGDVAPDALSDAQAEALRGWVAGGGLLVVGGPRFGGDERFRGWLPARWGQPLAGGGPDLLAARYRTPPSQVALSPLKPLPDARAVAGDARVAAFRALGRGTVVALGADAAAADFAAWPGAPRLWRDVARRGVTGRSVARAMDGTDNQWIGSSFAGSVLRAPGLRAPSFGAIGLFLLLYLVLLVPVNYAVLKRLDRREWTWLTVPLLVLVFSVGAYGFGYAIKGGQTRLNTASIAEMGPGDGRASVTAHAGLFSPRRDAYDVSLDDRNGLLYAPQIMGQGQDATPLTVSQDDGARVRDAEVAMWAMRVFSARTTTQMGNGIEVRLSQRAVGPGNRMIEGTVGNRTGRQIDNVSVSAAGGSQSLGNLGPGETRTVRLPIAAFNRRGQVFQFPGDWNMGWNQRAPDADRTRRAIRSRVGQAVSSAISNRWQGAADTAGQVLVSGWTYEPPVPLRVDGRTVTTGDHVNLLLVHAPVEGSPGRAR